MTVKLLVSLLLAATAPACAPFSGLPEGTTSTAHYMEIPEIRGASALMGNGAIGAGGIMDDPQPCMRSASP